VRLSPKSIFLGIVALGLPIVVTVGWVLGGHQASPPASAPGGGAGTAVTAPVEGTSIEAVGEAWSPAPPRPVAAEKRVPAGRSGGGRVVRPSATGRSVPDPTSTARPVPSPTKATADPSPEPTVPPVSAEPLPEP
jgi:hypothetical protein